VFELRDAQEPPNAERLKTWGEWAEVSAEAESLPV
jgi:hypothetical protein